MKQAFLSILLCFAVVPTICIAGTGQKTDEEILSEATNGRLKGLVGVIPKGNCDQDAEYKATVKDLNNDGTPEVFVQTTGTCVAGITGVFLELYIKDKEGNWIEQFGFPGIYKVLKTGNKGFPDIEIGGPGFCFPVWRWNGEKYEIYKTCP